MPLQLVAAMCTGPGSARVRAYAKIISAQLPHVQKCNPRNPLYNSQRQTEMDLPDHINADDDDEVEQYLAEQAEAKAKRGEAAHLKLTAGMSAEAKLKAATNGVEKILGEIAAGYSPLRISAVSLFVLDPDDLASPGSVVVLGFVDEMKRTEDAVLFDDACGSEMGCMSDDLSALYEKFKTPSLAMPTLVNTSPATRGLPAERREQLAAKWAHWFGCEKDWRHCTMSSTHRPSLGSWVGWPWELFYYLPHAIGRGVPLNIQFHHQPGNVQKFKKQQKEVKLLPKPLWVLTAPGSSSGSAAACTPPPTEAIQAYIQRAMEAARA